MGVLLLLLLLLLLAQALHRFCRCGQTSFCVLHLGEKKLLSLSLQGWRLGMVAWGSEPNGCMVWWGHPLGG